MMCAIRLTISPFIEATSHTLPDYISGLLQVIPEAISAILLMTMMCGLNLLLLIRHRFYTLMVLLLILNTKFSVATVKPCSKQCGGFNNTDHVKFQNLVIGQEYYFRMLSAVNNGAPLFKVALLNLL